MKKENKKQIIDSLTDQLNNENNFYLTDISGLNVEVSNRLRRLCFKRDVKLQVVKNTLLKKAMDNAEKDFSELYGTLQGSTSIMFAQGGNVAAKLIKEFTKGQSKAKPFIKGAYAEETCFVGENLLETLISIKSKNDLLGDLIFVLQSPARNVIGALQSGGNKIAGIVKTLSEK